MEVFDNLKGKTALITGGGRGIGKQIALTLSKYGIDVYICSRSENELIETSKSIYRDEYNHHYFVTDLSKHDEITNLVNEIKKKVDKIDILVNNAGYINPCNIEDTSIEEWHNHININLTAPFLLSKLIFIWMKETGGGNIINISSISGVYGHEKFKGFASYVASKYGLIGFTEVLSAEGREYNIKANAISPAGVDTIMFNELFKGAKAPLTPSDIANTVLFLVSDLSSGIFGRNIEVFG
jgi:NAD(P)-dependent dehydrogenase (short-subunit alcohol dehydrogenase family)